MGNVVGENLRRLRQERRQTQVEAARFLGGRGLAWTRDHLNNVELGRRPVIELNALWMLSAAYDVPLAEWFAGEGDIVLAPDVTVTRAEVRRALPRKVEPPTLHGDLVRHVIDLMGSQPADAAVAERLGARAAEVDAAARSLWDGRTVTEERDRRIGDTTDLAPRTLQAKRGAMTRQLTAEIRARLAGEQP